MKPKVKVLYAPGNNCHHELIQAFKMAGADPQLTLLTADLLSGRQSLTDCDMIAIPGGFSFGDHVAAGRLFALELNTRLADQLKEARERHIPMIGICNGFQILVNTGLLPGSAEIGHPDGLLDRNASAIFESRWVDMRIERSNCIWTQGMAGETMHIPMAHGEGRLLLPEDYDDSLTVFSYVGEEYPANPNGSPSGRAGITDSTGHILGLMPHPERAIYDWSPSNEGLRLFETGVKAIR
ncbi:phosphoribosylformylglycinamidine synthase I [bacterium]|nr:phosphoribosylformylglycinamidine synthase I [bacterium]